VRDGRRLQYPAADALVSMEWVERAERSLAAGGAWIRTRRAGHPAPAAWRRAPRPWKDRRA
jgi:hypothetical protein